MKPEAYLRIAERRGLPCLVESCRRTRAGFSNWCGLHRKAKLKFGHPQARRLLKKHFDAERREVRALFKAHADHPGLLTATAWIQSLLDSAAAGDTSNTPAASHLDRVARHGFSAREILVEVCAVWVYATRHPTLLPDDIRLDFALAVAVLFLAPCNHVKSYHYQSGERRVYSHPTMQDREQLGRALRSRLAPFFVAVVAGVTEQQQAAADAQAALSVPFNTLRKR